MEEMDEVIEKQEKYMRLSKSLEKSFDNLIVKIKQTHPDLDKNIIKNIIMSTVVSSIARYDGEDQAMGLDDMVVLFYRVMMTKTLAVYMREEDEET